MKMPIAHLAGLPQHREPQPNIFLPALLAGGPLVEDPRERCLVHAAAVVPDAQNEKIMPLAFDHGDLDPLGPGRE